MISLHFCSIPILQFINSLCQEEVTIMPNTYQAEFNLDLIWYWDDEASRRISGGWFLCRRGRKSASRERSGGTASRRGCQRSRGCRQWRHQCLVVWNHEMETYVGLEQESTEQIDNDENIEATLDDSSGSASKCPPGPGDVSGQINSWRCLHTIAKSLHLVSKSSLPRTAILRVLSTFPGLTVQPSYRRYENKAPVLIGDREYST